MEALLKKCRSHFSYRDRELDIDCIEIDPNLRGILQYKFGGAREQELLYKKRELEERGFKGSGVIGQELNELGKGNVRIIHDDFLSYQGYKRYSLILMNPPFADGDKHLLKALELQKNGGKIVCLLNAETVRNPYTQTRRQLMDKLNAVDAHIRYLKNSFSEAERNTDVEIALIEVDIPNAVESSSIYEQMHKAKTQRIEAGDVTDLAVGDGLDRELMAYQVEVEASLKLIRLYEEMKPYMKKDFSETVRSDAILTLTIGPESNYSQVCDVNKYLKAVRLKYWRALLSNPDFTGQLTSSLQEKYRSMVNELAEYDFTRFNVRKIITEMNSEIVEGVKDSIMELFDKLSSDHSYYGGSNNVHYYDGWKTNKAHKVNKKVVVPSYGIVSEYSFSKVFDKYKAYSLLSDIEKALNYLDGGLTQEVDLGRILDAALAEENRRKIHCKYFDVDIFKKGTVHITFHNLKLLDKLNIYAAKGRNWLPPSYGKASYADMTQEEKAVIDSFQGEKAYKQVLAERSYYLAAPEQTMQALMAGG